MPTKSVSTGKQSMIATLFLFITAIAYLTGCSRKELQSKEAFANFIESYTYGTVSRSATIKVQLAGSINTLHSQDKPEERELFEFEPTIKGKAYWVDANTIEFRPDGKLLPGETYQVRFNLGEVTDVPGELENFEFQFQVIKPSYKVEADGLKARNSSSLDLSKFTGSLSFADSEDPTQIEKMLTARVQEKKLPIKWQHGLDNSSRFTIDSIPRGKKPHTLVLSWDGKPIKADHSGNKKVVVPAVGDFKVLDVKAVQEPEQFALVQFSDPIAVAQDLTGLLGLSNVSDLQYTIDGSEVRIYSPTRLEGNYQVVVNEGIENIGSQKIASKMLANISFEDRRPSVSIPGKGNILPGTGKLTFPFDAVNLNAVDITIVKIYENNIPQYLQGNDFNGNYDLRRVAQPVVQKTIRLNDKGVNLRKKNRFSVDIDKLLRTESGSIYRITIGFRRSYSIFNCDGSADAADEVSENEYGFYGEKIDEDDDFWIRYDSYYPRNYNWEEKDNPCSNSYYTTERWATRNVIASNIALIAKRGNNNNVLIAATDILNTSPMNGVELKLLDYQQQVLKTLKTDEQGLALIELPRKPYLLVASKGNQRGYLKLDDGSSLPLSRFDVAGDVVQKGIKGFIYGERGVWRPGDSIYISFILEDKNGKLPESHPVTLEFTNPRGQLHKRITKTKSLNGFYSFQMSTDPTAPTGNWTAKIKVGGAIFQKSFKIETIMPNRLKIDLDFGGRSELVKGLATNGILSARWLFGAVAQNLKARIDATVIPGRTTFKSFPDYAFDDPTSAFESENKVVFDGSLNGSGRASFNPNIQSSANAPGVLQAKFTTKVFEPGGNFSIDNITIPYHVYPAYVGLRSPAGDKLSGMLLTDKDHAIDIVQVNTAGKLLPVNHQVRVELYKIQWRWWWDQEEENLSNFTQDKYNQLLKQEVVTLQNGRGKWNFRINYPEWGRYLIRVKDLRTGHTTGTTVYVDWPGWAQREQQNNPTDASMLSFTSNKEKYKVGEEVTLTIPSGKGGRGLVSIENGSKVLKTWWIETLQGQTKFTFKVDKEMAPNVYANVTLIQPHAQTVNDLPIRMYGTIPILVEDPQTILKPVITMAGVLKPESSSSLTVSEASGKAMTYTIAIVDDGLLDLTRFKTPDPHAAFYAREALGVKTWDLFDNVLGAWSGGLERILSIGGDAAINRNINPAKSNRFNPVVKYLGPFHLDKGQKKAHQFKLPAYIGSVRAMVVGGDKGAYGFTEKTVEVKKPLMLLATLPRVAGPGESFRLPVTVFALEDRIKNVNLKIQTNDLLSVSSNSASVAFTKQGEKVTYVDMKVNSNVGLGKIKITATSGSEKAEYNVELDIRNPNPFITSVEGAEIGGAKTWSSTITPPGTRGTNSGMLEISSIPPINLTKRLNYLIQYPHGCVEQITSSVFPQLVLNQLTDLTDAQKRTVERNINAGINRLKGLQTPAGGLGYWPGHGEPDEWGTNYAGHFMLTAQARGYNLPAGFLNLWKQFQRAKAVSWVPSSTNFYGGDLLQAYRLYLLALAKAPEVGAMNRLREFKYASPAAKWRLATAYNLIGQAEVAQQLIKGLPLQVKPYRQLGETFGSDLRDQAMILETLVEMGENALASKVLTTVASRLEKDELYTTQTTAYSLIAIAKYCGEVPSGKKLNFSLTINGKNSTVSSSNYLYRIPVNFKAGKPVISVINKGKNRLFIRSIIQGQAPAGQTQPEVNNREILDMRVSYRTRDGDPIDPANIKQGTDFIAEVTIRNPGHRGYYQQMALTQIFPAGWEIINTRVTDNDQATTSSPYTYRDIRDDRVFTYFNIGENKTVTYQVLLNASYLGKYFLPATVCEAMYDTSIQSVRAGQWVEVSTGRELAK